MMSEPTLASRIGTVPSTSAPTTNAGAGTSCSVSSARITPAVHSGTNTSTETIAVRRPLLGTTIARMNTVNAAYISAA